MRELTSHKVNGLNELLQIRVFDEPGAGGANHRYQINCTEPTLVEKPETWDRGKANCPIHFQNGPPAEVGVNGISNEALLAILIDRMEGFQKGPFACRENAQALETLQEAMHWMQIRTRERVTRGVEGTLQK